jgi:hypothetical protein
MTLQRPKLSDPAHEERGLQPQRDGRVRCSTRLGIISVSFILFPSSPGVVKAQRRTDDANPCQNRPSRIREQHTGKNGIDDPPDKVDVPRHPALSVHSCVGLRCHSSAPMRPVMSNDRMVGRLRNGAVRSVATTAQGKEDHPTNEGQPTNSAAISIVRAYTRAQPGAALRSTVLPRHAQASDNRSCVPARDIAVAASDSASPTQ